MTIRLAFAKALKTARKARGMTQEDFSVVSSRTYLSTLERGQKSPTLDKASQLSQTIGIHLLSLLTITYLHIENENDLDSILELVRTEVARVLENTPPV